MKPRWYLLTADAPTVPGQMARATVVQSLMTWRQADRQHVEKRCGACRFPLSEAVVAYDHARHAPLGDINVALEPGARAGNELTLETAKELRAALDRAIAAAEFEEAEVRGKGAVPSVVRAA